MRVNPNPIIRGLKFPKSSSYPPIYRPDKEKLLIQAKEALSLTQLEKEKQAKILTKKRMIHNIFVKTFKNISSVFSNLKTGNNTKKPNFREIMSERIKNNNFEPLAGD